MVMVMVVVVMLLLLVMVVARRGLNIIRHEIADDRFPLDERILCVEF